ncbi:hypothetical protein SAMN05444920_101724 [Nonomuraea solani]|uniref:Uncharacterized protein n=1 Tax=Nonomuraea solani TaxID=1144553 RepID=A0A1H5V0V7_9ACTN|nr:hypothetical protein [Nonomuraea solani]SEF80913.1 hypothetical protein SAMN05444920_101724 [Nonomuraea solani]
MLEPPRIENLREALARRDHPVVGLWNRLEVRPRATDFDRALRAEVRDALWMLTRQWQLGEFRGSDAGSPVTATYALAAATPDRFRPGESAPEDLPAGLPLEAAAERQALPFAFGTDRISFDLRLALGRRWLKLLGKSSSLRQYRPAYVKRFPIALPDPKADADTPRVAHPEVWSALQAVAGRRMDGYELYRRVKDGHHAYDGVEDVHHNHRQKLDELGARLVAWFDELIEQPAGGAAWDPRRLEHHFSVSGGGKVLTAPEYPGGELDWHAFSIDPGGPLGGTSAAPARINRTVFPAPVRFSGMPLPRWWAIEDGRTNFAAVRPDSTDLARLIMLEFALVYGNDWFHLPCDLPAGTMASILGLAVTDVFGQRLWVTPAGAGDDQDWQRWSMFTLDTIGSGSVPADTGLFLPPTVPKAASGPPLEEVTLIRDENANMVWGIERTVRLPTGQGRSGSEVAAEILAHRLRLFPPVPPTDPRAPIAYQAMNSVPEYWVPFIAVHEPGENRRIRLRRAAMPSVVDARPVRPRTGLLREGLDSTPQAAYFVHEEEVPQTGTRLTVAYNRTRWRGGRVVVWLSAQRGTGRGEGSSGLAFDLLVDTATDRPSIP